MPWIAIILIALEISIFVAFLTILAVVLSKRLRERKKDKYKDVEY